MYPHINPFLQLLQENSLFLFSWGGISFFEYCMTCHCPIKPRIQTCTLKEYINIDVGLWFQVQNLERAYLKMWSLYCSGSQPEHFKVTEDDTERQKHTGFVQKAKSCVVPWCIKCCTHSVYVRCIYIVRVLVLVGIWVS